MSLANYNEKQRHLLNTIIEPTGKTIDELAAQVVHYCCLHAKSVEILQAEPTKLRNMEATLRDPRTRPQNLIPFEGAGDSLSLSNIMFNGTNSEEAVVTLSAYDEYLKRVPSSFEDHFWFSCLAASGMMILEQRVITPQVSKMPGGFELFNKRKSELYAEMMKREFPRGSGRGTKEVPQPSPNIVARPMEQPTAQESMSSPSHSTSCDPLSFTREEAEVIADDFAALSTRRFNLPESYFDEGGSQSWKVVGIDFRTLMYDVLFSNLDTQIPYTRDDLVDLLTESSK
ncbi:hypothetical protein DENSPDRAFT_930631 [Dentipellis sp. KUC8613]|nr:hypothetical protein DENSPDRAFT_930631 [Dentipellis sp. KUC8613]